MPAMTMAEAQLFAAFLRCRLPYRAGESDHRPLALTVYARTVLARPTLGHWRDLSREDAHTVMETCRTAFPKLREAWDHPRAKS